MYNRKLISVTNVTACQLTYNFNKIYVKKKYIYIYIDILHELDNSGYAKLHVYQLNVVFKHNYVATISNFYPPALILINISRLVEINL